MEDFRNKWIFLDAKRSHAWLELPTKLPTPREGWAHEKLTDSRAEPLLQKMTADLKAERLTWAMIVREFLTQRLRRSRRTHAPYGNSRAWTTIFCCSLTTCPRRS